MTFPVPTVWRLDTAQAERDEEKRRNSPCSFFYAQGRALVTAAEYFSDARLLENIRGGVARKHRHRIHLALFGQLMASFEYMLKDFLAKVLDATDIFDSRLNGQKWIDVDVNRVLSQRVAQTTVGALLIHPSVGWHDPEEVNRRFDQILRNRVIGRDEVPTLSRLWIIRHSVAHNAGFVTAPDAGRLGSGEIAERVVLIDEEYILDTFNFLSNIARRVAECSGRGVLIQWLRSLEDLRPDYTRDQYTYSRLKLLATFVASRPTHLPAFDKDDYLRDLEEVRLEQD
jgi:hypothetical protein